MVERDLRHSGAGGERRRREPEGRGGVQVLDRAVAILEAISREDGMPLSTIASRAGVAPSTAHRILTSLEANGLISMNPEGKLWFVGVRAFQIGNGFLRNRKVVEIGRPIMRALMEETGETINLAIEDSGDVVYISQIECHNAIRAFHRPGTRGPMHASGMGKAILSGWNEAAVRRVLMRKSMPRYTERTMVEAPVFIEALREVRERGWAIDDEERMFGMRCVAAPIFNEIGEIVAAISISGPTARLSHARLWELGPEVKQAARQITLSIGGVARGHDGGSGGGAPDGERRSARQTRRRSRIR